MDIKWASLEPQKNVWTPAHNIIRLPGYPSYGNLERKVIPKNVWDLFTNKMLKSVIKWTNVEIEKRRRNFSNTSKAEISNTTIKELRALLSLLLHTSFFKSNYDVIECFFATYLCIFIYASYLLISCLSPICWIVPGNGVKNVLKNKLFLF